MSALPAKRMSVEHDPAQVIIFVTDPESRPVPHRTVIRRLFDLTNGEAALVEQLCAGLSLTAAAAHLNISAETARSRLEIIFQKTHTHRQVYLLRLVMGAV